MAVESLLNAEDLDGIAPDVGSSTPYIKVAAFPIAQHDVHVARRARRAADREERLVPLKASYRRLAPTGDGDLLAGIDTGARIEVVRLFGPEADVDEDAARTEGGFVGRARLVAGRAEIGHPPALAVSTAWAMIPSWNIGSAK